MKPNLFAYATSELSQDAIICWLMEWGKQENKDTNRELHQLGKLFLDSLFDKFDNIEIPRKYNTIKIKKQYKNIDVFCVINNKYALIIEDKTNTKNHSKQLEKYLNEIKKKFDESDILPIYFKTGDQSNYSSIVDKGYKVYLRKDFLKVINNPFENDILDDYKSYLQKIENSINSYKILPFSQWTYSSVKGFYMALQKELGDGNWDYVANANGGFLGFWWNNYQLENYRIYMQIDTVKREDNSIGLQLKFKLASGSKEKVGKETINKWKKHIQYKDEKFGIVKPRVVRAGRWTTIGILQNEFRVLDDEKINISMTVENIKKIEQILIAKVNTIV